ncbi:MAG: 16S rRNA (cytosine(1402)-N(4))-methyltransferase RsmH [Phycisphaerae bacterium]|nr:16S rRNA (cytosine(1402)-N(4))-methyltransferase RsmH [Phycisphaerae bacterium]
MIEVLGAAGRESMSKKTFNSKKRPAGGGRGGAGEGHVPVLLNEVLHTLAPQPGQVVADCTLGSGGHAAALAKAVQPGGRVVAFDLDVWNLEKARRRLEAMHLPVSTHHANFTEIAAVMAAEGLDGFDIIFADLGVSSMQIDDPARGMSYRYDDAPLDMRMNPAAPRTAADLLMSLTEAELSAALWELADEPDHARIAQWLVGQRKTRPITTTGQLKELVFAAKGMVEKIWNKTAAYEEAHPAMRTFQALRILVNDELASVRELLRLAPTRLRPGGRIGVISFHSGEDRLVKTAFRDGYVQGQYEAYSGQPIRPSSREVHHNPRSSSAKYRWAKVGLTRRQNASPAERAHG